MDAFITGLLIIMGIILFFIKEEFRTFVLTLVGLVVFGFACWGLGTVILSVLG